MEQKIKFIIIGLIGILVITILLSFQIYTSKQAVEREKENLTKENMSLRQQAEDNMQRASRLQTQVESLNQDLDRIDKEREDFQKKYDLANKAKEDLAEQLDLLKSKAKASAPAVSQQQFLPSPSEDSYWAGILKAKTDLELQLGSLRNELKTTQINNEQLQRDRNALDLDAKNLNREKEDLKRQLEYNQKLLDSMAQEVVRERNDKFKIQEVLRPIKNENSLLRRQLKSLVTRKMSLERKVQKLQEDNSTVERRFNEMETMLKDKIDKISELKRQMDVYGSGGQASEPLASMQQERNEPVELPPIVVRPQTESVSADSLSYSGRIIGVNKENNFVIIDLGEDAGIKIGDTFQVYREGEARAIATIEAIQARQSITACDIKRQVTPIKVGDRIR